MSDNIGERPRLDVDVPDEFRIIFDRFSKYVLTQPGETRQTIADLRAGTVPFEPNAAIAENIGQMLDLTDNGKDINFDSATVAALLKDKDYSASARKFREFDKEDPRKGHLMREVALLALDIYADRAFRYKRQPKREKGRVA